MRFLSAAFFVLISAVVFGAHASSQAPNPSVDPVAQAISAQIEVTRSNLTNVMKQLDTLNTTGLYSDPDYNQVAPIFKSNVNQAMEKFDATMTQVILPRAQKWLNEFRQYADPNQDNDKFVSNAAETTKDNLERINDLYHKALAQILIDGLPRIPAKVVFDKVDVPHDNCNSRQRFARALQLNAYDFAGNIMANANPDIYCLTSDDTWFDRHGQKTTSRNNLDDITPIVESVWVGNCKTSDCRLLRYNDLVNFVDLVDTVVNREFILMDYRNVRFSFSQTNLNTYYVREYAHKAIRSLK